MEGYSLRDFSIPNDTMITTLSMAALAFLPATVSANDSLIAERSNVAYRIERFTDAPPSRRTPAEELGTNSNIRPTVRRRIGTRYVEPTRRSNRCEKQFLGGTVELCIPNEWETFDVSGLRKTLPSSVQLVGVFNAKDRLDTIKPSLVIRRDSQVRTRLNSVYLRQKIREARGANRYARVRMSYIPIDGRRTPLHVYQSVDPFGNRLRHYDLNVLHNGMGYSVTATVRRPAAPEVHNQVMQMFKSLQFKNRIR